MDCFPVFSERLTLRRFQEADLSAFVAYRSDPEVARYQSWSSISVGEAREFIRQKGPAQFGIPGRWFQIAIALSETDKLIGDVGLCIGEYDPARAEIGFTLSRENQGRGFASEAVKKVLELLFEKNGVERIEAITDSRNVASIELLRRVGMKYEKTDEAWFKDAMCHEHRFAIRKQDWAASMTI
jgi:RimJ/RimL family protein N-acetyltransferase